jgi:hypothetical protein
MPGEALAIAVARAAVDDPEEIRGAVISKRWQRYRVKARAKVYARPRSVRINQELEERTGLIVLSGLGRGTRSCAGNAAWSQSRAHRGGYQVHQGAHAADFKVEWNSAKTVATVVITGTASSQGAGDSACW